MKLRKPSMLSLVREHNNRSQIKSEDKKDEEKMKQSVDIGFTKLCVEIDEQGVRPEVYVFLENKDNTDDFQEICMVSQAVDADSEEVIPDSVRCLVWSNEYDESYTHEFDVKYFFQLADTDTDNLKEEK